MEASCNLIIYSKIDAIFLNRPVNADQNTLDKNWKMRNENKLFKKNNDCFTPLDGRIYKNNDTIHFENDNDRWQ